MTIKVLQTSDIHSHFLNNDNPFKLGGLSRLATKISTLRRQNPNTLTLDAGDFTEGSIFFTYNTGESTHRIMESMNYDAIVLGNHDWLVGPQQLFQSLESSGFKVPILSANLNFNALDPKIALGKYLHPYLVKELGGVKVGVLGLSTFQFIFDQFFLPVKLIDPVVTAKKQVEEMRASGCKIIIVLSHLGFSTDKTLARSVNGIDLIVGGHSHILLKTPAVENGTLITHVGKWGQYLGEIDLRFDGTRTVLGQYKIHEITEDLPEDPFVKATVEATMAKIEKRWGPIFNDKIVASEVDLAIKDYRSDNIAGHWVADGFRLATRSEVAFDNSSYASRDIYKGFTSTADFFNIFPHIYNPLTDKAWTVKTFDISGGYLKLLAAGVVRTGVFLKLSNAKMVLDLSKTVNQLYSLSVASGSIENTRTYRVAGTDGVLNVIDYLKGYGIDIGVANVRDTGLEAWRVTADYFKNKSPINREKLIWEGRVRTLQPDLTILPEEISTRLDGKTLSVMVTVRNTGLQPASATTLSVLRAERAQDTLGTRTVPLDGTSSTQNVRALKAGEALQLSWLWNIERVPPGRYAMNFSLTPIDGEMETENNILDSYVDVPKLEEKK